MYLEEIILGDFLNDFYIINNKFQTRPKLKYGCLRLLSFCPFSSLYTANLHGDIVCEE